MADDTPGKLEAAAAAFAGTAFAGGALLLRHATVVPAGMFDGAAAAFFGWGLSVYAHRAMGRSVALLLRGLALAAGALLAAASLLPPFDRSGFPAAAWLLGAAALQASTSAKGARSPLAGAGVALILLGCGVGWMAADAWPETARLRFAVTFGGALALAGLGARLAIARKHERLAPGPVSVILFAALAAIYLAYRPLVAASVANLPLYEWTLGVGAAALMLGRLRSGARDTSVPEAWSEDARRHELAPTPVLDPRQVAIAVPIQRYLDTGEGFEEYRAAMLRGADGAPPPYRKTLQGAKPVQARGRAAKAARRERLATHAALMELLHGHAEPAVRAHP